MTLAYPLDPDKARYAQGVALYVSQHYFRRPPRVAIRTGYMVWSRCDPDGHPRDELVDRLPLVVAAP